MYYSYVEIEYVATSFFPARTDLAVKLLSLKKGNSTVGFAKKKYGSNFNSYVVSTERRTKTV